MVGAAPAWSGRSWPHQRLSSPFAVAPAVAPAAVECHSAGSAAEKQAAGTPPVEAVVAIESRPVGVVVGNRWAAAAENPGIEVVAGIDSAVAVAVDTPSLETAIHRQPGSPCIAVAPVPGHNPAAARRTGVVGFERTVAGRMTVELGERWARRPDMMTSRRTWL